MPPEWMWALDEELIEWFEHVEEERKRRFGDDDDDDGRDDDEPAAGMMMKNEYARGRGRG